MFDSTDQTHFKNPKYDQIQGFYGTKSIKIPFYRDTGSRIQKTAIKIYHISIYKKDFFFHVTPWHTV